MSGLGLPDHNKWDWFQANRRHLKRVQGEEAPEPKEKTVSEQLAHKFQSVKDGWRN